MKKLTIGMCTYDDFDGVYFTIQSLRLYHSVVQNKEIEFIVVDNNPNSPQGRSTASFIKTIPESKYIPYTDKISTSTRNQIFSHAAGKYTLCLDCHVLLYPNSINALLAYYENNQNCLDIVHGPIIQDSFKGVGFSHFKPVWGMWMYGQWGSDKEKLLSGQPFEIPMQGLGLFSCETKNWRGFSELFKGFGGEEGYIHEKFRQHGGKAICIPQLKWLHRFGRPNGVPYPNKTEDRVWNYFVGWLELTKDTNHQMIKDIFRVFRNKCKDIDKIFIQAKEAVGI